MKRQMVSVALLLSLFGAFTLLSPVVADDKRDEKKADEPKTIEAKLAKSESAAAVDFNQSLGLQFESLNKLGACIQEARKSGDPVALGTAATCLAAAEAASGKTAKVTSEQLFKESVKMAKAREIPAELKAVAALTKGHDGSKELLTLAETAEKHEADRVAKFKSGEKSRGIIGQLTVRNNTRYRLYVSVNFAEIGWIDPYTEGTFSRTFADRGIATFLNAQNSTGDASASRIVNSDSYGFTWIIND